MANIIWKFRLCPPKRESVSRWIIQIFFSTTHVATWNVFYQHLQLFIWGIRSTKWCLANFVWYLCISAFLGIPGCQAIGHGWHLLWWANQNQPCESQRCKIICRRPSSVSKFWIETIFFLLLSEATLVHILWFMLLFEMKCPFLQSWILFWHLLWMEWWKHKPTTYQVLFSALGKTRNLQLTILMNAIIHIPLSLQ